MRILVLIVFGLILTACQGTNPYGLTTASIGESVVSSATGQAGTGVSPVKGIKYVLEGFKQSQKEISESFGGIQQELDNFIKGVSTPLNESDDDPEDRKVSGSGDIDASSISADTPEEKAFIATVRELEGTAGSKGYNTWFGGRSDMDLSQMTVSEVVAEQKRKTAERRSKNPERRDKLRPIRT